jgi:hypothetical protein
MHTITIITIITINKERRAAFPRTFFNKENGNRRRNPLLVTE